MTRSSRPGDDGPAGSRDEVIRATFDWSEVTPSTAVVETVAIAANRDPLELEPLFDSVDPDALDTLVRSTENDSPDGNATVRFVHDGYEVTVHRDGTVVVRPVEASADQE